MFTQKFFKLNYLKKKEVYRISVKYTYQLKKWYCYEHYGNKDLFKHINAGLYGPIYTCHFF